MLRILTSFILLELCVFSTFAEEFDIFVDELAADEFPRPISLWLRNEIENTANPDELFPNRIVNGVRISILNAPYQVAILRDGDLQCGGSILNRIWILTAAHCIVGERRSSIMVRAGSDFFRQGGQLRSVRRLIVHAGYDENTSNNDIAMIKLKQPLNYNAAVQPTFLPSSSDVPLPTSLTVSGWGVLNENAFKPTRYLRQTALQTVSRKECSRNYRSEKVVITEKMICMLRRGSDSCQGDSGGALVADGVQYGIVSFGIGCARRTLPGVYTDVRKFLRWINEVRILQ